MPQLPVDNLPSVNPVNPSGQFEKIDSNASSFGGLTAEAGAGLGKSVQDYAVVQQTIKNEADHTAALNKLLSAANDLQYGNPQLGIKGYNQLQGQDAMGAIGDYRDQLKSKFDDIRATLNPAVAKEFDNTGVRILRGSEGAMGAHYDEQTRVYNHQAQQASIATNQQAAIDGMDDPQAFQHFVSATLDASHAADEVAGSSQVVKDLNAHTAISKIYQGVTERKMLRDPVDAANFYQNNIGMIDANQRFELESKLKTHTDAQYADTDGQTAYLKGIGTPQNNSPLPARVEGSTIPAFDQKRIQEITTAVKSKSQYDPLIQEAAAATNVSPYEIKLKMAIENAKMDPNAVSSTGAIGLGQFMPDTAAQYGVTDRSDPKQSIMGIAKMLAANGGTVGSDMTGADKAYIGKGPDADQYVENTRAARQALFGPPGQAPLTEAQLAGMRGTIVTQADAEADARRPGDLQYRNKVEAAALSRWSRDMESIRGQQYAARSAVLGESIDANVKSFSELSPAGQQAYTQLEPAGREYFTHLWKANSEQGNPETPDNQAKTLELLGRASTDPAGFKSQNPQQLVQSMSDLSKGQQHQVMAAYVNIDKNAAKNDNLKAALDLAQTSGILSAAGITIPTAKEKDNPNNTKGQTYYQFAGRLQQAIDQFRAEHNGVAPKNEDLIPMIRTLTGTVQYKKPGSIFGNLWPSSGTVHNFEVGQPGKPTLNEAYPASAPVKVPDTDRADIVSQFQSRKNRAPTEAEIQTLYNAANHK